MSNPYGGNPYGGAGDQNQYGQPQYGQYGAPGGPGGPGGPGYPAQAKTDGVSIAAFVSSLICCAPVGLVLGFVGLGRTKNGQRKGRWAAVTGIVLGVLGLGVWALVIIGLASGISWLDSVVTPGNAEVGQCVDIEEEDNTVLFTEKECTEPHDGEIVATTSVDDDNVDAISERMTEFCSELLDPADLATITENQELALYAVIEDPNNVEVGDHLACYVESDTKLEEPIL